MLIRVGVGLQSAIDRGRYCHSRHNVVKVASASKTNQQPSISTADPKRGSFKDPRNLEEQMLMEDVLDDPLSGQILSKLSNDPRFKPSDGWQKMSKTIETKAGKQAEFHYQYNNRTGETTDLKAVDRRNNSQNGNWINWGVALGAIDKFLTETSLNPFDANPAY